MNEKLDLGRRQTMGKLMWAFVGGVLVMVTGCPTWASIESTIKTWVPVGLSAFAIICTFVPGLQLVAPLVVLIKAGFADVLSAVDQYQAAPAAKKMGLLGKLSEVITILEGNLNQFWTDVITPAGGSTVVEGMMQLLLSIISGFLSKLPMPTSTPAVAGVTTKRNAARLKGLNYAPRTMSVGDFRKQFDQMAITQNYKGDLL